MTSKPDQLLLDVIRESRKLNLEDIRLVESFCKLGDLKQNELPPSATQSVEMSVKINPENGSVLSVINYSLDVSYEESKTSDPAIRVVGKFAMCFGVTSPIPDKYIRDVIEKVSSNASWPYWREFIQSMSVRMGLPAFPVPLIDVAKFTHRKSASKRPPEKD